MPDKQGELFPEDKPKKKPSTNPRAAGARRKRARKKGDEGQRREEAKRGGEQLTPEELWPNYPNMGNLRVPVLDPQDDWQTSPDFDREKGGWQNRNALTIQKLFQQAQLGRTALQIVKGVGTLLIGRPDGL